jgi:hypothetical protein
LGILPRVLEERLGASAYNLAILGGQAPSSYFLLRRVLERGYRPKAVIVNFSALLLAMDPRLNAAGWSTLADGLDGRELAWRTRDPAFAAALSVPSLIPSWSFRDAVRTAVALESHVAPNGGEERDDLRVFERNWRLNRGAQVAPRHFVPIEGALSQPSERGDWSWRPHPTHAFYVERFLRLAQSQGTPVFWVLTPAMSEWRERIERAGMSRAYREFIQDYLSRFPGLTILDGHNLAWDRWAFRDPIHLNRDGALSLSVAVADSIRPRRGGSANESRWIELGRIEQPPPSEFQNLLEDLDQSRLAVHPLPRAESAREESRW